MNRQNGLSLIELMVAILISSILILGVTDLFNGSLFSSQSNSELTRMQESARIALEVIGADARRAGYHGCTSADDIYDLGSGHSLPDDAITSTSDTDVTFRFADPSSGCVSADGTYTEMTFNGKLPSAATADDTRRTYATTNNTITRNDDPMLDDATMTVDFIPTGIPLTATAIRVTIVVSDSRTTTPEPLADRTFSATYELRNRL